jgi:ATP-dependent DNA helicase DinG
VTPYISDIFADAGLLARAWPGYRPRAGQIDLAEHVNRAIREAGSLLIEAPTGTGKSVGYLAPVIWHLTEGRESILAGRPADLAGDPDDEDEDAAPMPRAIICTANIALQEQLVQKDLPALRRILPWPFSWALAKGRGNYLCRDRFEEARNETLPIGDDETWGTVETWAAATKTGDLSELPIVLPGHLRSRLTIASDDCTRRACPKFKECWPERAKAIVAGAEIIIANYHLLFAHVAMKRELGFRLLPHFDLVIFDEAHEAANVARDFFGVRMTEGMIGHAARMLAPPPRGWADATCKVESIDPDLQGALRFEAARFFEALRAHMRSDEYGIRLRHGAVAWEDLSAALRAAAKALGDYSGPASKKDNAKLARSARKALVLDGYVRRACFDDGDNEVPFIEEERGRAVLRSRLIDVGPILNEELFAAREIRSVVATSATLATGTARDAFVFASRELGAKSARCAIVASPFDFQTQALLVVPRGLPEPKEDRFAEACAPFVLRAAQLASGRTLGLFTSARALAVSAEHLRANLRGYTILVQGDAPRNQLIDRFRRDVSSVLLGTKSFWAGIDIQGEALSCLVIDRIPFDPPTDPIVDALAARGANTFREWTMPRAIIQLRQGFGRLIRDVSDRGVVVILDRRLAEQPFGREVLRALPPCPRSRNIDDIARILAPVSPAQVVH